MPRWMIFALILNSFVPNGFSEDIEFLASSNSSIEIPAGQAIQVRYIGAKGDATAYMKLKLTCEDNQTYLKWDMLSGMYLNGPATIESEKAKTTNTSGTPYKLGNSWYVLKDTNNSGTFSKTIYTSDTNNADYIEYLNWLNSGNQPIPSDVYTGTNLSSSGFLVKYKKFTNQPFQSIIIKSNETKNITISESKTLIIPRSDWVGQNIGVTEYGWAGSLDGSISTGWGYWTGPVNYQGLNMAVKGTIKNGYDANFAGAEIDGPEILSLSFIADQFLAAGGSSTTTSGGSGAGYLTFGIFNYCFADTYPVQISQENASAMASTFVSTPGNFGLATKFDLNTALSQSRTDGINNVLSNPNLWTLYTANQIQNMAMGDLVLNKNTNGNFTLNYDIEQSTDLLTWTPYQALSLPLNGLPTNKAFVRIKFKNTQ